MENVQGVGGVKVGFPQPGSDRGEAMKENPFRKLHSQGN